jgi:hypothetical protein
MPDRKDVFTIVDSATEGARPIWNKVGSAFVNKDGSLNVKLAALPVNGTLHIRDPRPASGGKTEE